MARIRCALFFVYSWLRPILHVSKCILVKRECAGLNGFRKIFCSRTILSALLVAVTLLLFGCGMGSAPAPQSARETRSSDRSASRGDSGETNNAERYDLGRDEDRGGHTLERHVARTDEQLAERLSRERNISAASTWTNREIAEEVIGEAMRRLRGRIDNWMQRGERRPNLALHYDAGRSIGRSMPRGDTQTVDCTRAVIVLRGDGSDGFYVLTAYPEASR
jgi:Bacterial CdiA-CT RNAse A domain